MLIRTLAKIGACFFLFASVSEAQYLPPAGVGPLVEGGLGYSYVSMGFPSTSRVGMNGLDANITADFLSFLGARADLGYGRTSNVFNSGHHSDVLSYLAGPVFYPFRRKRLSVCADLFVGGARVTGVTPNLAGRQFEGFTNKLAWAYGVGFQYSVSKSVGIRIDANDLHTAYFNSSVAVQGQENLRIMISLVWYFGDRKKW